MLVLGMLCACKKTEQPAPAAAPPAKPSAQPAATATTKWIAIDALGIEVEAPACADLTPIDADSFGVGPDTPACPIAFPGVVFTRDLTQIAATVEEQARTAESGPSPPQITRKDKTATGWILEWKTAATADSPARPGINERYHLAGHDFACIAFGPYTDEQMHVLESICTSARAKK